MKTGLLQGQTFELLADLVLNAGTTVPTFDVLAYGGGLMFPTINGKPVRAVADLAGLEIDSQRKPLLKAHDATDEVGHTEVISNDGKQLTASGLASGTGPAAKRVIESAKNKFPWKASVGLHILDAQQIDEGQAVNVNGRTIQGPFILVTKSRLKEISAVTIGGDDEAQLRIAASAAGIVSMDPNDPNKAGAASASAGTAAVQTSPGTQATNGGTSAATVVTGQQPATLQAAGGTEVNPDIAALRTTRANEIKRINQIETLCAKHGDIAAQAISEGWSVERAEVAILRAERPTAPAAIIRESVNTPDVLTAGLCMAGKLVGLEKAFPEKTLDAADRVFKGGRTVSLQRLVLEAANAGGYNGHFFDKSASGVSEMLRAAFSTRNISGVLSNVANKFLLEGYNFVEQTWRKIARIRPVNDFKTVTSYRLLADGMFEEVPASGQIPHGELDEQSFTNRAKTYGKMFGIPYQDLVNDDLGALTSLPKQIGRGAGLKLNNVFWTEWKNDTTFFSDSNTPDNKAAVALGITGLTTVKTQFNSFLDPQGNPLGSVPRILLVPPGLEDLANQLRTSQNIVSGNTTAAASDNPHKGLFEPAMTRYLTDPDDWYLLADPNDIAGIEVAFFMGVEVPTVEQSEADFNTLGIQMRGVHHFGVNKQDFRCGVKSSV